MGNGPTGQTRSSNPPPACGAACARVRRSRFGVWPHGKAHSARPVGSDCAFPSRRDRRMRLSVRVPAQNALFRRVRLSSPGQTWRHLTEKRTLQPTSHGKAHSATCVSRKAALCPTGGFRMRFSVTSRRPGCGAAPRQAAGHYGKRPNWANALEQPPASLRGGLRECPQISVRSLASRKGALCPTGGFRMRFSVTTRPQNALFRRIRLSSPGQTWRHLMEKRILLPASHGKAHSATYVSRKGALCNLRLTESRTLPPPDRADCAFPSRRGARGVGQLPASLRGGLCQVAETGTTTSVTAPVRRAPLHARSNRAGSFKLPLRESRL